jgi:hypothetical protein
VTERNVRAPAAAGSFYPGSASRLAADVDALLDSAPRPSGLGIPKALIVPHAGYAYSGQIAAAAYVLFRGRAISRVALFGPAHFVSLHLGTADGWMAVPEADSWRTPLGDVPIDADLRARAIAEGAIADDRPHEPEHSLEVQLPFLQRLLGEDLAVLPVAVGIASPSTVADMIATLMPLAMVIVSTDLSHFLDDATAKRRDRRTADAVLARDPDAIGPEDACGSYALRGIVELARRERLEVALLDLRTSADTAGDPWRVVGYGAFALT